MAKRTMTDEQKKRAVDNLAKARAAKKAKEAEGVASVPAEASSPVQPSSPEQGEKNVVKAIRIDNEHIPFIIPLDPSVSSDIQWWERSINGHILRLQRGKLYELPRYLVDYIETRVRLRRMSEASAEVFTVGSGKQLNF